MGSNIVAPPAFKKERRDRLLGLNMTTPPANRHSALENPFCKRFLNDESGYFLFDV
jgi:hypothetical protein